MTAPGAPTGRGWVRIPSEPEPGGAYGDGPAARGLAVVLPPDDAFDRHVSEMLEVAHSHSLEIPRPVGEFVGIATSGGIATSAGLAGDGTGEGSGGDGSADEVASAPDTEPDDDQLLLGALDRPARPRPRRPRPPTERATGGSAHARRGDVRRKGAARRPIVPFDDPEPRPLASPAQEVAAEADATPTTEIDLLPAPSAVEPVPGRRRSRRRHGSSRRDRTTEPAERAAAASAPVAAASVPVAAASVPVAAASAPVAASRGSATRPAPGRTTRRRGRTSAVVLLLLIVTAGVGALLWAEKLATVWVIAALPGATAVMIAVYAAVSASLPDA